MPDRGRLLADEEAGARSFDQVVERIPPERRTEPTVTPDGWTPVMMLGHVAGWLDECTRVLGEMRDGSWGASQEPDETDESVAERNAAQVARAAALTWSEATEAVAAARVRARAAWKALPEITSDAWSWFEESGPNHYAKHIHDLSAWLAGDPSDPDVGRLLQADAEGWVGFARLLETVPDPTARDDEGWNVIDMCHHVGEWMNRAAVCIEHNAGFGAPWEPEADLPTDEVNARILAASRDLSFGEARLELDGARDRLRGALAALARPTGPAKEAFQESTVEHYDEHRPMLRRLTGSA